MTPTFLLLSNLGIYYIEIKNDILFGRKPNSALKINHFRKRENNNR